MHIKETIIGLVGVGLIGTATAERLIADGFKVAGWDLDSTALQNLARLGSAAGRLSGCNHLGL